MTGIVKSRARIDRGADDVTGHCAFAVQIQIVAIDDAAALKGYERIENRARMLRKQSRTPLDWFDRPWVRSVAALRPRVVHGAITTAIPGNERVVGFAF